MIKVVKIGGNIVDNPALLKEFAKDFAAMPGMKILVHGGGVMASQMQKAMGLQPVMIEGRRVTDENALKVVTMDNTVSARLVMSALPDTSLLLICFPASTLRG